MKTVEISNALFTELQKLATPLVDTLEDVIWRLIKKEKEPSNNVGFTEKSIKPNQDVFYKGGRVPWPIKLRMKCKGTTTYGETNISGIWFENQRFKSPSQAACYVARTKGAQNPSINGWTTIEYLDEDSGRWRYLDYLRDETDETKTEEALGSGKKTIGKNVTKRKPCAVIVMNKRIKVVSWRNVKVVTFNQLLEKFPSNDLAGHLIKRSCGHTPCRLRNGKYTEVNRSAEVICRQCREAVKACGLMVGKDWQVELLADIER